MSEAKRKLEESPGSVGVVSGGSFGGTGGLTGALEALKARARATTGSSFVEYLARRIGPKEVEIAKFEGGSVPTSVYHVQYEPKEGQERSRPLHVKVADVASLAAWMTCDCPAGAHFRLCKHLQMVEEFLQKEPK